MPPKMIKCCICGKEVSKRKSLEIGSGRACRNHPETQKMVNEYHNLKKEKEKLAQAKRDEIKNQKKFRNDPFTFKVNAFGDHILNCYRCTKEGVRSDIWAQRALIDMHKKKILSEPQQNALDFFTKSFKKEVGGVQLFLLSCEHKIINNIMLYKKYREFKEFTNMVLLCEECLQKQKVPDKLYKPSIEQVKSIIPITAFMEDDLNEMAQAEIDSKKEKL